jgi:hypothetical protein
MSHLFPLVDNHVAVRVGKEPTFVRRPQVVLFPQSYPIGFHSSYQNGTMRLRVRDSGKSLQTQTTPVNKQTNNHREIDGTVVTASSGRTLSTQTLYRTKISTLATAKLKAGIASPFHVLKY